MNPEKSSYNFLSEALLCVMMLPLLFAGINNFHDWGDDFAQYILQAKKFSGQIETLPVSDVEGYGPGNKGILFSMLLAPIVHFENQIAHAKIFVSLSLMFCGLMFFKMLKSKFNNTASLLLTLFFVYNIHVLRLKDQILPDLLFTGVLLCVFLFINSTNRNKILAGLMLAGISTGLKSAGFAMVIVLLLSIFFGKFNLTRIKSTTVLLLPCLFFLIWEFSNRDNTSGAFWYTRIIITGFDFQLILQNAKVYYDAFVMFFEQELPQSFNTVIRLFVVVGVAGGLVLSLVSKNRFTASFILTYLGLLLVYPYSGEPIRFLIVLIPFLLIMMVEFYVFVFQKSGISQNVTDYLIALCLAGSQIISVKNELTKQKEYDPWTEDSREMIEFVKNSAEKDAVYAFTKPWALALFSNQHCVPQSAAYNADFIVFRNDIADVSAFTARDSRTTVFKNREFTILKTE